MTSQRVLSRRSPLFVGPRSLRVARAQIDTSEALSPESSRSVGILVGDAQRSGANSMTPTDGGHVRQSQDRTESVPRRTWNRWPTSQS